jgi:hypothetical protein
MMLTVPLAQGSINSYTILLGILAFAVPLATKLEA